MSTTKSSLCSGPLAALLFAASRVVAQPHGSHEPPSFADDATDGPDLHTHGSSDRVSSNHLGYDPEEGFRLKSPDGDYLLRLALQLALKIEPSWTDGEQTYNGTFAFLRPILRGNFYKPWLGYRVSMDLAGESPHVLDAYVDVAPWEAFGFRFGQQGTPISRHNSLGPAQLFFPEYAGVASYFWSGRERGLTVYGTVFGERLDYYAGMYSGSPLDEPVNVAENYVVEGRITVNPLGPVNTSELPFTEEGGRLPSRLSFTLQGFHGKLQTEEENYNQSQSILSPEHSTLTQETSSASADLWLQSGPAIVFGECYWRSQRAVGADESIDAYGAWGQIIVNAYKNLLGLGVRGSWIDPNIDLANDRVLEAEAQVAWFVHPPELVLKLRYAWLDQQTPGDEQLAGFTLPFVAGTSNLATLQLTMAF